ncbi:MAG: Re/Si-specific NAD(P)(+) transhydrogenase subunit alpha [Vicinamibacteria bacterium]
MIVATTLETFVGERRVAIVPAVVPALKKLGLEVVVEAGAGYAAGFEDAEYVERGARVAPRAEALGSARLLLQVRPLAAGAAGHGLRAEQVLVGFLDPMGSPQAIDKLAGSGAAALALELVPRITRAQSMDALSSMATVAGYKAVLLAADALPRLFPMLMTAAGTVAPAHVLVIGAGVAGLQAIATARRLGGVVEAYDIRPAVKEQIESLGARFVELPLEAGEAQDAGGYAKAMGEDFYRRQRELLAKVVAQSDVVIATAAVPGKRAPVLLTAAMVDGMAPGSVVLDLAAEQGGNCELTRPGETVVRAGVSVLGPTNVASSVPYHASQMLAKNFVNLLGLFVKKGELALELDDEIVRETLVCRGGQLTNARVREALGQPAQA